MILVIAVFVTFAGSAAAIRRAVQFDPVGVCEVKHERDLGAPSGSDPAQLPSAALAPAIAACFSACFCAPPLLRRGRALSALFAVVVAASVATAMMNLYVDVQAKLRRNSAATARTW